MDEMFSRYLDPAFRYVSSQGPARVRSRDDALRGGLDCVALAHLVIRDLFGYALPARLQALELTRDLAHFEPVPDPERMRAGDLVWLGVGTNALWPLRRSADYDRYRRIYAIRRLRGEFRRSAGTSGGAL